MIKKMKKGFTLIELLAVIVILAVIALITTPMILGIIETARKGSFKASVNGILQSVEYESLNTLDTKKDYYFPNSELNFKGEQPKGGYISVDEKGQTSLVLYNDNYCVTKNNGDNELTITEIEDSECEVYISSKSPFVFVPETGTIIGYDESYGTDVVIPYAIDGVPVKKIGDSAFISNYNTVAVTVIDTTTSYCAALAEMGQYCYYEYLYDYAVANNIKYDKIVRYNFTEDTVKTCYNQNGTIITVGNDEIKSISDGYFACSFSASVGVSNITSLDLSKATALEEIGNNSFAFNKISNIKWNSNIKKVGSLAFISNLITDIDLSNFNLETIGEQAFADNKLTSLDLTNTPNLKKIGMGAFTMNNLQTVNLGTSKDLEISRVAFLKQIQGEVQSNSNLTSIINGTGNSYDWENITMTTTTKNQIFEEGTVIHSDGNIVVSKNSN